MGFGIDALVGGGLAGGYVFLARRSGAERLWIGVGLFVAGALYPLMGLTAHPPGAMPVELFGVALFGAIALLGAVGSVWLLALGWALHAVWDLLLPWVADTGYVPPWYAAACLGFDLVVAVAMAARASRRRPALPLPSEAR
jgi:hypothetical protein